MDRCTKIQFPFHNGSKIRIFLPLRKYLMKTGADNTKLECEESVARNEESGGESVTYGINTLRIGEIRQNGVDFYVMVETEEVTSDSSDVTKGEYVVHLVAEDKKVTVSEVVDVLEEN